MPTDGQQAHPNTGGLDSYMFITHLRQLTHGVHHSRSLFTHQQACPWDVSTMTSTSVSMGSSTQRPQHAFQLIQLCSTPTSTARVSNRWRKDSYHGCITAENRTLCHCDVYSMQGGSHKRLQVFRYGAPVNPIIPLTNPTINSGKNKSN